MGEASQTIISNLDAETGCSVGILMLLLFSSLILLLTLGREPKNK